MNDHERVGVGFALAGADMQRGLLLAGQSGPVIDAGDQEVQRTAGRQARGTRVDAPEAAVDVAGDAPGAARRPAAPERTLRRRSRAGRAAAALACPPRSAPSAASARAPGRLRRAPARRVRPGGCGWRRPRTLPPADSGRAAARERRPGGVGPARQVGTSVPWPGPGGPPSAPSSPSAISSPECRVPRRLARLIATARLPTPAGWDFAVLVTGVCAGVARDCPENG